MLSQQRRGRAEWAGFAELGKARQGKLSGIAGVPSALRATEKYIVCRFLKFLSSTQLHDARFSTED